MRHTSFERLLVFIRRNGSPCRALADLFRISARRASPTANKPSASEITLESRVLLAAKVIVAPASYEFRDMGFDPVLQKVAIVGYEWSDTIGGPKTAKLFELNSAGDGFTAQTLVGLGAEAKVNGISSDGSRIAGVSIGPPARGTQYGSAGTTWLRSSPSQPVGTGFLSNSSIASSSGMGAWAGGVVGWAGKGGEFGVNGPFATQWTPEGGLVDLGGNIIPGGYFDPSDFALPAFARDVSADGSIIAGEIDGVATYWNSSGANRLDISGQVYAISPNGRFIGGYVAGTRNSAAAIWDMEGAPVDGTGRNSQWLYDANTDRVVDDGSVFDISNHGYAVGRRGFYYNSGFIWHPTFDGVQSPFNGVQEFGKWLLAVSGTRLGFDYQGVEAIAEDPVNGKLLFALSAYDAPGASAFVEVDVAGIDGALVVTSAVHQGKLAENVVSTGIATLEVGLRGTSTFDVTKLDRASLFIGDDRNTTSGRVSSIKIKDVDGDGFKDAIITLKSTGTLRPDTVRLKITGQLTDGTRIDGSRTVTSTTQSVNAYWQATTGSEWKSMLNAYTRGLKKTWW